MKFIYTWILISLGFVANAQINPLQINKNIILPKDSVDRNMLVKSLNDFLTLAQKPNEENTLIFASEKLETFILLDELKGIEKRSKLSKETYFKPYLTNIVDLGADEYLIQISYIGATENVALLRANFEIIAHKTNGSILFSSPLLRNTRYWKTEKVGNNIFHYQNTINKDKVAAFNKLASSFDLKLKSFNKKVDYYCIDNIVDLQKLTGVLYKSDYNGKTESIWSSSLADRQLILLGNHNANFSDFDPHDLFHDRLSLVITRSKVNNRVDEGCAYLYGGSWGLTWNEILKTFKEQIASNRSIDWTEIKERAIYFKTKGFNNSADHIINALLVKKIEREKGFAGVWELLNVGPYEKGNEKYYSALEKLTGITKANYNKSIWELIEKEQ